MEWNCDSDGCKWCHQACFNWYSNLFDCNTTDVVFVLFEYQFSTAHDGYRIIISYFFVTGICITPAAVNDIFTDEIPHVTDQ